MATDSNVVYSESAVPGGRRTAITILGLAAVALVASVALELWWLLVPAVLVLLVGGVLLLSLWLYSTVRLTTEELSVGRDRLDVSSLDPVYGIRRGEDALPDQVRASLEIGFSSRRGDLRILGGAWGRPATGTEWLVVQDRNGSQYVIASRHPQRLSDALHSLLNTGTN
ncbi:MAG: DUF3093 family protein [Acidimicrobiia bacterium]|nr:DUF3093 family protein [Acidimicrobiia bacterium]MDH5522012.1 DUF3093 family protein [Acidimicrobiia bacterium]